MIAESAFRELVLAYLCESNPDLEPGRITSDTDLLAQGYLNSLRIIELVLALEETLGISIFLEDIDPESFRTITGLYAGLVAQFGTD